MLDVNFYDELRIGLATADQIREWSHGEVKKPETINYRTLKPERDGLFCEKIFGPTRDWECNCGKYKRVRFKGIICERCGVEVTRSNVRRERMGHIELAAPVTHIWYFKGVPSRLGYLLDIAPKDLEKVIYFAAYMITAVDEEARHRDLPSLEAKVEVERKQIETRRDVDAETRLQKLEEDIAQLEAEGAKADVKKRVRDAGERELKQLRTQAQRELDRLEAVWTRFKSLKVQDLEGDEILYREMKARFGKYFAGYMGAEAIKNRLATFDLAAESLNLREIIQTGKGQRKTRALKRLKVVSAFLNTTNSPLGMVLDAVPVIPPDLRPMVQLDGGRFATSDLNDLYRRVINRNNRLKRLLDLGAPEIIVNNEKRMLQEAVDSLFDNGRRGRPVTGPGNRPLKSISDMLKGKQGRFRQNLLGKRVDYSGRSVIVVGPQLKLHQCGLPKNMALELFKPFVMKRLDDLNLAQNIKSAKRMVERQRPVVWDVLEEVIAEHPVLLNRAPTLHRLGIQAFEPQLIEGKAIQLHPLVCTAFNADFDGDQMAVHLPLSWEAQAEARTLMLSTNNILSPAHGKPIAVPSQDMVIGIYYLTYHERDDLSGVTPDDFDAPLLAFSGYDEVVRAYEQRILDQRQVPAQRAAGIAEFTRRPIQLRLGSGERIVTTVGRALFNHRVEAGLREVLGDEFGEDDYRFHNHTITKKGLSAFINELVAAYGATKVARMLDVFKDVGFQYATRAAVTVSKNDVVIPEKEKAEILRRHDDMVASVQDQYNMGFLTEEERRGKIEEIWREADVQITAATKANFKALNPIYMMATSGARGDIKQIRQLAGWRGQMANPKGEIVEQPVKSSFIEGLSVLEFFISTHGARKGLADTALRTADSGYLTRRLVDVCQDVTVSEEDCGTTEWVPMSPWSRRREENPALEGRTLVDPVKRPRSDRVVLAKGTKIGPAQLGLLREIYAELPNAKVKVKQGTRGTAESVAVWTHDPNENLLGRHLGAPIVDEGTGEVVYDRDLLIDLEVRDGVLDVLQRSSESDPMVPVRSVLKCDAEIGVCQRCYGYALANNAPAEIGDAVGHVAAQSIGEPGTQLTMRTFHTGGIAGADITHGLPRVVELFEARKPKGVARLAEVSGRATIEETERGVKVVIHPEEGTPKEYPNLRRGHLLIEDGDWVEEGTALTPGSLYPADLLRHAGPTATERYLVNEVQEVYRSQGVEINDKHVELIVRQMMKKVRIVTAGDTVFLPGQLVDRLVLKRENQRVAAEGDQQAEAEHIILGITKASLATESFLSAASFQETTKVLTDASIEGKVDYLQGLKENVIIGKLIPAGTGLRRYREIDIFPAGRAEALEAADRFMTADSSWAPGIDRDWDIDD